MHDKTSIKKIEFNVHGKKLELTAEEAKELKQILSDLFGETQKVVHEWYPHSWPHWNWPYHTWYGSLSGISNATTVTSGGNAGYNHDTLYLTVN